MSLFMTSASLDVVILLVRCRVAEKVQRTDTVGDRWFMSVTTNWTFRHHKRLFRNLRTHHVLSDRKCARLKLRLTEGQFSTDTRGKLSLVLCVCGATADSPGVRHLPFLCHGCSMIEMVLDVHVVLPETFVRHDISQCCRLCHNDQGELFELVMSQTAVLIGTTAALLNDFVFVSFRSGI